MSMLTPVIAAAKTVLPSPAPSIPSRLLSAPAFLTVSGNVASSPDSPDRFTRVSATRPQSEPVGLSAVRIVYNNDTHEKFKQEPHIVTGINQLARQGRTEGRDVLCLNSGDNNVGNEAYEWLLTVLELNKAHYDAVTMGNHELDPGSRMYSDALKYANFPTILSNLDIRPGSAMAQRVLDGKVRTRPVIIRRPQGSYGIIGVTTPKLMEVVSHHARLEGEEVEDFEDTVALVRAQVQQLQAQGINKIILLSHMGLDDDKRMAQLVPGIDVIVSGHSHEVLDGVVPGVNYFQRPDGENTLILQAGKNAQWLGAADILFDAQGRVIPQKNGLVNPFRFAPDAEALALRNAVLGVPKPLAMMATAYDCNGSEYHADALAQFTADAVRAYTNTDIAMVRSPEIRSNFDPGELTDQDLKALMPFNDPVVRLTVSGAELLSALNKSAQGVMLQHPHPGMLHPSGLQVQMDAPSGQVTQVRVFNKTNHQWEPLNPDKMYSLAMGEFGVSNGEFEAFTHPDRITWNSKRPLRYFFEWGLHQAGAPQTPIHLHDDGRLQVTGGR